jgi:hypothetical protein
MANKRYSLITRYYIQSNYSQMENMEFYDKQSAQKTIDALNEAHEFGVEKGKQETLDLLPSVPKSDISKSVE